MRFGGRRFLLSLAILGASVCLALGISLPVIKLTSFVFWTSQHSLLSTVEVLLLQGQWFLGLTVLVFSIVFPVLKLLYLLLISTLPNEEIVRQHWRLRALEWLGKWSMHDVLVLALMIFFIKSQGVYDATSLNGVYFFTAAIVLMILAYAWLPNVASDAVKRAHKKAASDGNGNGTNGVAVLPASDWEGFAGEAIGDPPVVKKRPFRNFVLSFFIILATVCFALGVILPVIRFTTVYVWSAEHSIVTIIWALYENGELFLCAVLFIFSILFPFLKLFYLLTLVTSPDLSPEFRRRSISTMEWLGRYSMTDVMVLALMIFYVNSSGYTEAVVQPGVYFFAASALMTMLAYGWANSTAPKPVRVAAQNAAHTGGLGETVEGEVESRA
ncbi:MAG: paraquat-inducible protein A [Alphaproteobacteria bacterium]|nr:paraquat-inducible protein A [Alphaproteobacteria bacterium]